MRNGLGRGWLAVVVVGLLAVAWGGERAGAQPCEAEWAEGVFGVPGVDGTVRAMVRWDDGSGDALYVGGYFSIAGSRAASNIARWDGERWSALGPGGPNAGVRAVAVFDDGTGEALYVGGAFRVIDGAPIGYVARWDGSSWSAVGDGLGDDVRALMVFDDGTGPALYAAGDFQFSGTELVGTVARWDGDEWSRVSVGDDQPTQTIFALTSYQGRLVAGGSFYWIRSGVFGGIASWDGDAWTPLGVGLGPLPGPSVRSLAVAEHEDGPVLYAGGSFSEAGGAPASNIARWDGEAWSPLGDGVDGLAHTMLAIGPAGSQRLLVGGEFARAGAETLPRLAAWDGQAWSAFGDGSQPGSPTFALLEDDLGVLVGGQFRTIGSMGAYGIARYDDDRWSPLGDGLGGSVGGFGTAVIALDWFDDGGGLALFAAGQFLAAGGERAGHVARWDGASWDLLSGGVGPDGTWINDLAVYDHGAGPALYVGGRFTTAGGLPAAYVARWDGAEWSSPQYPGTSYVTALHVFDDGSGPVLFVAGGSDGLGSRVLSWDGTSWMPIGTMQGVGVNDLLRVDESAGTVMYAAIHDASFRGRVMRWDGVSWSPVGGEFNAPVESVAEYDDGSGPALLAGGGFTQVDGADVRYVARWDPASGDWIQVGTGLDATSIRVIAVGDAGDGPALYAGGTLRRVAGERASGLARLRDGAWEPTGPNQGPRTVLALSSAADSRTVPALYVGHTSLTAGGVVAPYISLYACPSIGCKPDLDADGALTVFDFLAFLNLFDAGDLAADFDGDGALTIFDFLAFQNEFDAGCG